VADVPNVIDKVPVGGGVNTPASGAYGEGAALDRLKSALPGMDPAQSQATEPLPMSGGGPPPSEAPADLPKGLLAPTRQPGVPVSSPLPGPVPLIGSAPERRLKMLEALVSDPEVSADTKQWASTVLAMVKRVR
jgi:hypothetical protein